MSGIVVITTKGGAKRDFVNILQEETGGAIALAVLQNVRKKSLFKRILSFYKKVGFLGIIPEIYYFLAVKLSPSKKYALAVLSTRSAVLGKDQEYLTKTIETDNVNEDLIYEHIKKINPDIIVIWGGYILKPRLLEVSRFAVNMHSGYVPYYRGVNGVEQAILNDDLEHIGISVHYAVTKVDAGGVIDIVTTNHQNSPEKFFKTLNDLATRRYIDIIKEILKNGKIQSKPQDTSNGRLYLLKDWTYKKQYTLAKKILNHVF